MLKMSSFFANLLDLKKYFTKCLFFRIIGLILSDNPAVQSWINFQFSRRFCNLGGSFSKKTFTAYLKTTGSCTALVVFLCYLLKTKIL